MLNHTGTPVLHTKRLTLRPFALDDAQAMFENWAQNPNVTEYLRWTPHQSIDDSLNAVQTWVENYKKDDYYQWGIEIDGVLIGSVGAVSVTSEDESCEFGYCMAQEYWGRGIMPEACEAIFTYLFDTVGFHRICAMHAGGNPKSGRVMQKMGMRHEGTQKMSIKLIDGSFDDLELYGILKEEFDARHQ